MLRVHGLGNHADVSGARFLEWGPYASFTWHLPIPRLLSKVSYDVLQVEPFADRQGDRQCSKLLASRKGKHHTIV